MTTALAGNPIDTDRLRLGARCLADGRCEFRVWAPGAGAGGVQLQRIGKPAVAMEAGSGGYYSLRLKDIPPGTRYSYLVGGKTRPDPASRYQPDGVHSPSEVVAATFVWTDDAWANPPLAQYVLYEMHTGTFSAAGTFDAVIPRLPYLKDLGVTAIELMPVSQFPGGRNWGYDGVFPFAVQNTYGGPAALKRLVNAAHRAGLAVVLDVVYNHLGPEGNYLRDFGPYFIDRYKTPWGDALNFDGPDSDEVRQFFIENALYWTGEFHIDALRLDAIHAIFDSSALRFLQELATTVRKATGAYVMAESDLNDVRVIRPDGLACDALWSDSLHHVLHVLLTGEHDGYYQDFGGVADLAKAYNEAFVYSGQYSKFRRRRHGNSTRGARGEQFVVCAQNHDQIGNRAQGDRLSALLDFESLKLAAGAVILSPFLPLLFMGEEYGETAPFLYFTSHGDDDLIEAVRRGRQEEFGAFAWQEVADPQAEVTFSQCRLTPQASWTPRQRMLHDFYRELLRIRRDTPALAHLSMERTEAVPVGEHCLRMRRWCETGEAMVVLEFSQAGGAPGGTCPAGRWRKLIDSADSKWDGPGGAPESLTGEIGIVLARRSLAVYERVG
ncbi:MAG TPA: malto-oligosyltrehalose trehalohydrolase [Bryobacteraceae bacterium]|jgi:maltooligosyltrehalose trehalohydrolase|nr:malto-oligosyltrehalose trehalohydrolase [Bryobacteraceae bacterium]